MNLVLFENNQIVLRCQAKRKKKHRQNQQAKHKKCSIH